MSVIIKGGASSNLADVNTFNNLKVTTEVSASDYPQNVGAIKFFSENDPGSKTGIPNLVSPESDQDYRIRIAKDSILDNETFNYLFGNTGKHFFITAGLGLAYLSAGLTTNSSSLTTTGTGLTFNTYAEFPLLGGCALYVEIEGGFSQQPAANVLIDFGVFRRSTNVTPFTPSDGVMFRLTSAGLQGIIIFNGSETSTGVFDFTYANNQIHQFIITLTERHTQFWIDDVLYGEIPVQAANGTPCSSATLPFAIRHAHTGAAGSAIQFVCTDYNISIGGMDVNKGWGETGNYMFGSYQGISGNATGSLSTYFNSTNPTAAIPSNTALTANLPTGLGGQAWETFTTPLAQNTDGILMSYQVPTGSVFNQGKRLKISNVKMSGFYQTLMVGGPSTSTFSFAFGHTAVSLATAETSGSKARRIVLLPEHTQYLSSASLVNTVVTQPGGVNAMFSEPIYVNPGEFVAYTVKHLGTAFTSGVIAYNIQYGYSWE